MCCKLFEYGILTPKSVTYAILLSQSLDFLKGVQYNIFEHCLAGGVAWNNKEANIQATIKLIEEKGEHLDEITVREICKRASVGLGLVNYHFSNKEKLIEQCIERMINGTVE